MFAHHAAAPGFLCECCDAQPARVEVDLPGSASHPCRACESCFADMKDAARDESRA